MSGYTFFSRSFSFFPILIYQFVESQNIGSGTGSALCPLCKKKFKINAVHPELGLPDNPYVLQMIEEKDETDKEYFSY